MQVRPARPHDARPRQQRRHRGRLRRRRQRGEGIFSWLRNPFPGEEYFLVDLQRTYSSEWPSVELRDGKAVIRRGFLEPLDDPNAPFMFFYRYVHGGQGVLLGFGGKAFS